MAQKNKIVIGPLKKKKRFSVVYRRCTHDKRKYGTNPFIPHFLDIFYATRCRPDKETLERVRLDERGYHYTPSLRYQALKRLERIKLGKHKAPKTNEGRVQGHFSL